MLGQCTLDGEKKNACFSQKSNPCCTAGIWSLHLHKLFEINPVHHTSCIMLGYALLMPVRNADDGPPSTVNPISQS
jgi:hypothetical protein